MQNGVWEISGGRAGGAAAPPAARELLRKSGRPDPSGVAELQGAGGTLDRREACKSFLKVCTHPLGWCSPRTSPGPTWQGAGVEAASWSRATEWGPGPTQPRGTSCVLRA